MASAFPPPPRRTPNNAPFGFTPNDEWDDEEEDDDIDENGVLRTRVEDLPPAAEIDGDGGYTEIDGEEAQHLAGRSSSPRLFVGGAGHPTVTQLKVYRVEGGLPVSLGAIESEATEEDLVRQFFDSMPKLGEGRIQFRFRPIDSDNRELGVESSTWISENHVSLQRMRAARSAQSRGSGGLTVVAPQSPAGLDPLMMGILTKTIDRSQSSVDAERLHSRTLMEQIGRERIDLAQNVTASVQQMSERMLSAEASRAAAALAAENNRNQQAKDSMAAFFQSQMDMMAAQREVDRSREEQRIERERLDAERRMKEAELRAKTLSQDYQNRADMLIKDQEARTERMAQEARQTDERRRAELEEKQKEEDRRWQQRMEMWREERRQERLAQERRDAEARAAQERREAEAERRRQEERERDRQMRLDEERRRQEEREREREARAAEDRRRQEERERERDERNRRELAMQREHEFRLKMLEVEAEQKREHEKAMATVRQMELQAALQSARGTDIKSMLTEAATLLGAVGVDPKDLVQRFLNPPVVESSNTEAWADLAGKVIGSVGEVAKAKMIADSSRQRRGRRAALPAREPAMIAPTMPMAPTMFPQRAAQPTPMYAQPAPQQAPQQAPVLEDDPAETALVKAPEIDLPFAVQRTARAGLRDLLGQLRQAKTEQWESLITVALMQNTAIYDYIQAVSLTYALREAGSSEDFSEKVIDALLESPLVPDDLNYGFEEDDIEDGENAENAEGGAQ